MSLRIIVDNWIDVEHCADLAVSPAAANGFPVTNVQSNVRDATWKATSLAPQVFTGSFGGSARMVSALGIFPALTSTLLGSAARWELFSDAARATTAVYDQTFDFFTPTGLGWGDFAWGAHPWGVAEGDRTARQAPLLKWITRVAVGSWRLTLSNAGAVETVFEVERLLLGDYVQAPYNAKNGAAPRRLSNSEGVRTPGGILRRLPRGQWSGITAEVLLQGEADRAIWRDILHDCDVAREVVVSFFSGDASAKKERDHTYKGSLMSPNREIALTDYNIHTLQLEIEES